MKFKSLLKSFVGLLFINCSCGQTNKPVRADRQIMDTMSKFEYSLKTAHAKAQAMMTDEFYWSPIEETGPFGNDDGWEAAYGFRKWRISNKSVNPIKYLKELISRWNYPSFDWNEMDTAKIAEYLNSKADIDEESIQQQIQQLKEASKNSPDTPEKLNETQLREIIKSSSKDMGGLYLLGQDNAIIGTGFAQFVLEGKIDNELKALTIIALKRELLPQLINRYDNNYRAKRKEQLYKMLDVVKKMNS